MLILCKRGVLCHMAASKLKFANTADANATFVGVKHWMILFGIALNVTQSTYKPIGRL